MHHFQRTNDFKKNVLMKSLSIVAAFSLIISGNSAKLANAEDVQESPQDIEIIAEEASEGCEITAGAIVAVNDFNMTFSDMQQEIQNELENAGEWANKLMADIEEDNIVEIYSESTQESEQTGQLKVGDVAEVKELNDGWYKITSGELEGYVEASSCVTGEAARVLSEEVCDTVATSFADGLRIRTGPSTESGIISMLYENDSLKVNPNPPEMTEVEAANWIPVLYGDKEAFISSKYADVAIEYGTATAVTAEEIEDVSPTVDVVELENPVVSATADDLTLLGALIQCEAGGCPYEGMLAVGAVVLNRMRSGYADGTLRGVIYQPSQFTPAMTGKVDRTLANGVSPACIEAAREALAGVDNTGGCLNFRAAWTGHYGTNIGGNVFF